MLKKKKTKSFVVSINDATREISAEKFSENINEDKKLVSEGVKIIPNIKLNLGEKKKSSLISINSSFNVDNELVKDNKSNLNVRNMDFSESKLLEQWGDLIFFLIVQGKSNLGIALEIHKPKLLKDFLIELPLSNAAQVEIISEDKYIILEYLRDKLENDRLEITTKIVELEKSSVPYTNKDKFKKMSDENSQLEILRIKLGLDPDY